MNQARRLFALPFLLVPLLGACSSPPPAPATIDSSELVGDWRAVLSSPGGELPFTLRVATNGETLSAVAISGEEDVPLSGVIVEGREVLFDIEWYDSSIRATLENGELVGRWRKTTPEGESSLGFAATRGVPHRFTPIHEPNPEAQTDISGVWAVEFVDDSSTEPARGEFQQTGDRLLGTFLTPTGDYRFLEGSYEEGLLRLSTFDGAHAFLFKATSQADGTLAGDFWSRDSYHATWTARRAESEETILPSAWELAGLTNDDGLFRFAFPDLEGNTMSNEDERFAGKVVLVNIFGSWCPNCNDEAPLLAQWDRKYRELGLESVGLAYEFSGNPERDRVFVAKYAERHGVEFPLLLAGISDKAAAAETLPDLSAVIAFPTTILIGRDGKVRKVHSGFSGPGTGDHFEALRAELEGLIESLLEEAA